MRCVACGAEMQLREVAPAGVPTMPAFERHTFRCSACPQTARRLVICRDKMPVAEPLVPPDLPPAPTKNLQTEPPTARSSSLKPIETLHRTQATHETIEKLAAALNERAVAARASAWAKTVEKLRAKQAALQEKASAQARAEDGKPARGGGAHAQLINGVNKARTPSYSAASAVSARAPHGSNTLGESERLPSADRAKPRPS
jgi:hypothetical protein